MGLDQYAIARKEQSNNYGSRNTWTDLEDHKTENIECEDSIELAYWRKHPNLQGFMEVLWRKKGNSGDFNCIELELTLEDLDKLEKTLTEKCYLQHTVPFLEIMLMKNITKMIASLY